MIVTLGNRTADLVRTYFFLKGKQIGNQAGFTPKGKNRRRSIGRLQKMLLPNAKSFGQTVYADGKYVGDVWCYCIDMDDNPNCMLFLSQNTGLRA